MVDCSGGGRVSISTVRCTSWANSLMWEFMRKSFGYQQWLEWQRHQWAPAGCSLEMEPCNTEEQSDKLRMTILKNIDVQLAGLKTGLRKRVGRKAWVDAGCCTITNPWRSSNFSSCNHHYWGVRAQIKTIKADTRQGHLLVVKWGQKDQTCWRSSSSSVR